MHIAISALTVAVAAIVVWWSLHPRRIAPQRAGTFVHMRNGASASTMLHRVTNQIARSRTLQGAGAFFSFVRPRPGATNELADIIECLPVASVVFDEHGVIVLANAQAERLFDYPRGVLAGACVGLVAPALSHEHRAGAAHPGRSAGTSTRSLRARRRDGSEFSAEIAASAIRYEGRIATVAFITDMTERFELERNRRELAHLTRISTMGELAASLAHELNQPLTAILSNGQAAQRFMDQAPIDLAEVRDILKDIVDDSGRASEVIRRMRAFVKKEEQQQLANLDVGGLLRDVALLVHGDAVARGIHVSHVIDDGLPPVRGDKVQLQQVLLNLLLNAFDAVSECGASDRVVALFARPDGEGRVRIAVRDRGHGQTADKLECIFKPFVTSKPQGLGLGLSISRSIVQIHGGRLWAENNFDQGMTFYVALPASRDASNAGVAQAAS
ncbi:two-component system sensor histidine kinase NtrB [Paraburkholderia caribensis]|uniref:two-component system sensor histidine kinase NtrB n=1 Tax=Paraburkholderia caribensis TaxID=75105 RepID=UPI0006D467F3|nr:PAS domain-containing sensor histidine kinase [Paraburkholderia caribensis]AMV41801.1 PAS domain-containing sensor histidine kinase [Paraburkholderia caribensis]MDR6387073.1 two-component system sensor kinase FixL [Paraburkholderia caribensis]CAG9240477.1 Histidine kinase [Paraburkholderia caribensis]